MDIVDRIAGPHQRKGIQTGINVSYAKKSQVKYFNVQQVQNEAWMEQVTRYSVESLHHASTFGLDARVREYALQLQDKVCWLNSTGDLIALEANTMFSALFPCTTEPGKPKNLVRKRQWIY